MNQRPDRQSSVVTISPSRHNWRADLSGQMTRLCLIVCLAPLTIAGLSCSELTSPVKTAPSTLRLPPKFPTHELKSLAPSAADLSAAGGSTVTVASYPFTEGVIADITITGTITLSSDSRASPIKYSGPLDFAGVCVPYGSAMLDAKVTFSMGSVYSLGGGASPSCNIPRTMGDYSVRALVAGTATAVRGPLPVTSTWCGPNGTESPCVYTATGSQHITIAPVAGALDFEGTNSGIRSHSFFVTPFVGAIGNRITGYHTFAFTDSTVARGLPQRNLSKLWIPADPLAWDPYWRKTENTCYAGNLYCDVNIKESGTMTSTTRVNGVVQNDSVLIYCLETESLLNNDQIRQQLMAVFDSSNADDPDPENRHERWFLVLQDTVTPGAKPYLYIMPLQPGADVCQTGEMVMPDIPLPWPNTKIIALGHDHTSAGLTTRCKNEYGQYETDSITGDTLVFEHVFGASTRDWRPFRVFNDPAQNTPFQNKGWLPLKSFVIDKTRMYTMRNTDLPGDETKSGNLITWGFGRCKWPRRL